MKNFLALGCALILKKKPDQKVHEETLEGKSNCYKKINHHHMLFISSNQAYTRG